MHSLGENKEAFRMMSDFVGNKLDKVGDQLVETRVAPNAGESGDTVLVVVFIKDGSADVVEVELQFL